jgi:class 3 adenylate cyclase
MSLAADDHAAETGRAARPRAIRTGTARRDAAPAGAPARIGARMRLRYVLTVASVSLVDIGITGLFILVSGNTGSVLPALAINLSVFGAMGGIGAWLVWRPIGLFLAGRGDRRAATRRLARLPAASVALVAGLTVLHLAAATAAGVYLPDRPAPDPPDLTTPLLAAAFAWFLAAYAVLYAFYVGFATADLAAVLRERLHAAGVRIAPPPGGRFARKLTAAFAVGILLPAAQVVLDVTAFQPVRARQGLGLTEVIVFDLAACLFAVGVSLVFVGRALTRPIDALSQATARVRAGDLTTAAPVASGDELGRLARRFNAMVRDLRERQVMRTALSSYLGASVARAVLGAGGDVPGEERPATVMFTDIAGFSAIAERLPPREVAALLDAYFAVVVACVEARGGTVNNFLGDSIIAVFNVPDDDPDHAANAVRAALDIVARIGGARFGAGGHALDTRIGIATGLVHAGPVGGAGRLGYTVYGDVVNLAARLEGMNTALGTRVLATAEVAAAAAGAAAFRPLGPQPVRGRAEPVETVAVEPTEPAA